MKNTKDIKNEIVAEINGYQIVRSECRNYNDFTGEYSGQTKVFYDVCTEEDLIESFKTLREAKKYCKEN